MAYFFKTCMFYACFISLCMNQSWFMHGNSITCKKVASMHEHAWNVLKHACFRCSILSRDVMSQTGFVAHIYRCTDKGTGITSSLYHWKHIHYAEFARQSLSHTEALEQWLGCLYYLPSKLLKVETWQLHSGHWHTNVPTATSHTRRGLPINRW